MNENVFPASKSPELKLLSSAVTVCTVDVVVLVQTTVVPTAMVNGVGWNAKLTSETAAGVGVGATVAVGDGAPVAPSRIAGMKITCDPAIVVVPVGVEVLIPVAPAVTEAVSVAVAVAVAEAVEVAVLVTVGANVAEAVSVAVAVSVSPNVAVGVAVSDSLAVDVSVGVSVVVADAAGVPVDDEVDVGVRVGVSEAATTTIVPAMPVPFDEPWIWQK